MTYTPTYEELEQKINELEKNAIKREQIEDALRTSEERLALALEAISDGIWDWDIEKGLTYASERCGKIFGIKDNTDLQPSDSWAERIHPDDYDMVSRCLQEHLKEKTPYDVEYRHLHNDGEYHWQSSRGVALFDENGNARRMVGSIRDITERKKAEEQTAILIAQLQQAQKMEAMGTLAGGVAHDFNNLLTAILGNIELSQMYTKSEKKIDEYLIKAKNACRRAKDLTRQFITFAKSTDSEKQTGDISKLIQDSTKLALTGNKIKCEFNIPDNLLPVNFNGDQIKQVIGNLVHNSIDAMNGGGTIEIRAENIDPDRDNSDDLNREKQIKISVQDHGAGIPKKSLEKIFDPYFSSKETVTQKGMGLGLSICYSIIQNHNGCIEVESREGTGTTFNIFLPAA